MSSLKARGGKKGYWTQQALDNVSNVQFLRGKGMQGPLGHVLTSAEVRAGKRLPKGGTA